MPITLTCVSCGKQFRARDESVGKRVKCPYCATATEVPPRRESEGGPSGGSEAATAGTSMFSTPASSSASAVAPAGGWGTPGALGSTPTSGAAAVKVSSPLASSGAEPPPKDYPRSTPTTLQHSDFADPPRGGRTVSLAPLPPSPPTSSGTQVQLAGHGRWKKVAAGLRGMALGLWLLMVPGLAELGKLLYVRAGYALPQGTGWVSIPGYVNDEVPGAIEMSKSQQLDVLLYGVPVLLGGLFLGFGRLTCGAVPREVGARGAFAASGLFTLLYMAALLSAGGAYTLWLRQEAELALIITLVLGGVAEVWCLIGLCSTAAHCQEAKTSRMASLLVFFAGLWIGWVLFGHQYYAAQWRPQLAARPDLTLWEQVAFSVAYFLTVLVYLRAVAGARRAVREQLQG